MKKDEDPETEYRQRKGEGSRRGRAENKPEDTPRRQAKVNGGVGGTFEHTQRSLILSVPQTVAP